MIIRKEVRIRDVIGILFLSAMIIFGLYLLFTFLIGIDIDKDIYILAMGILMIFMLLITMITSKNHVKCLLSDFKNKLNFKEICGRYLNSWAITIGVEYLLVGIFILINTSSANEILNTSSSKEMLYTGNLIINSIKVVMIAPILEEIIYRKVIFTRLAKKTNISIGVILSSIIFGLSHAKDSMFFAILFGVVLCILYLKYENILVPIFLHFMNNLMSTLILLVTLGKQNNEVTTVVNQNSIPYLIFGSIVTIIGLYFYIRYINKNKAYLKIDEKVSEINI
ncbi:CPBP family intramembrane glutamic endopeptidase [[Clostridium] dakarense]|uniref:CPBP family intramembrane glutamic endopeptidase n=1 Tax=Faecalimicrobium dakarense TaxID=1301100 RepID=UPI0004AD3118|nr:type II CAAX endopeptidase family protein [[Clostridium] dakarense]